MKAEPVVLRYWIEAKVESPDQLRKKVDTFREAVQPSNEWGLTIYECQRKPAEQKLLEGFTYAVERSLKTGIGYLVGSMDGISASPDSPVLLNCASNRKALHDLGFISAVAIHPVRLPK